MTRSQPRRNWEKPELISARGVLENEYAFTKWRPDNKADPVR